MNNVFIIIIIVIIILVQPFIKNVSFSKNILMTWKFWKGVCVL